MGVESKESSVIFSGELTIQYAKTLRREMQKHLGAHKKIAIKFETISGIDLSFLQLLCSMHRECLKQEKTVTITTSVPEQLRQIMTAIGFERTISCDQGDDAECMWKALTESEEA